MEQAPTGIIAVTREKNDKEIEGPAASELFGIPSNIVDLDAPSIAIVWILSEKEENLIDHTLFGPKIFNIQGNKWNK